MSQLDINTQGCGVLHLFMYVKISFCKAMGEGLRSMDSIHLADKLFRHGKMLSLFIHIKNELVEKNAHVLLYSMLLALFTTYLS